MDDAVKNRRPTTTKTKRPHPPKVARGRRSSIGGKDNKIALLTHERDEALEQQRATTEVLRVISSSPADLKPVFDVILTNSTRICHAKFGMLWLIEGSGLRCVALHNAPAAFAEMRRREPLIHPTPKNVLGRLIDTKQVVHIADLTAEQVYAEDNPIRRANADLAGARTLVAVPMLKDSDLVGAISIYRQHVQPFTDKQIELVQNFAAQAVIAIENARLLNELRQRTDDLTQRTDDLSEALEQQTATSEVLKVISSSRGELEPVFQAMLENATRLCDAKFASLHINEGGLFRTAAQHNTPAALNEYQRKRGPFQPRPGTPHFQVLQTKQVVHTLDHSSDAVTTAAATLGGAKSHIVVPMLKDEAVIGAFVIYRQEIRRFSDKQIELVQNFAAQAVIAIENARLLNELRHRTDDLTEALEQQTATSEVLKVISSSPGNLEPVFDTMLENAVRICEAGFGVMFRFDDDLPYAVATLNLPPAADEFFRQRGRRKPTPGSDLDNLWHSKQVIHTVDMSASPNPSRIAKLAGVRTQIAVPMLKDGALIGSINIFRQEVRPFTDKHIELVQYFAAQAVVAIENTRLLNELRQRTDDLTEALEQQTATSEVLKVVSGSPGNLQPVFQAMLENATRICLADSGTIYRFDGEKFHTEASFGETPELVEFRRQRGAFVAVPGQPLHRLLETLDVVQSADDTVEAVTSPAARLGGARSHVAVPMFKEGALVGAITIYRKQVQPFTDKQIALVQNFAAQAVIAIENARLLNELRESLQQQTATSEVLKVISSSPGELDPVFRAMLENAVRICEAKFGRLFLVDGDRVRLMADLGVPAALTEHTAGRDTFQPMVGGPIENLLRNKKITHVPDILAAYPDHPAATLGGSRSFIAVPMLKEDALIGLIVIYRQEVQPFTDKQIALVQNFAAQAVIAIENTRLLTELRQSLEQQTATADVLKVISRSTFDLQTVLDTLVASAARLCHADRVSLRLARDGLLHYVSGHGYTRQHVELMRSQPFEIGRHSTAGRAVSERVPVHILDIAADPEMAMWSRSAGGRTTLGVPLLREGVPVGVLILQRGVVQAFTDKEIELVTTFADQAVIAIENARLLNELRQRTDDLTESLEQQTATSEVLKVISSSPGELKLVFNAILENATRICEAKFGVLFNYENGTILPIAHRGVPEPLVHAITAHRAHVPRPGTIMERVVQTKDVVHVEDIARDDGPSSPAAALGGARTFLSVPMLKDGTLIGAVSIYRQEVLPFTGRQIELVRNFAAQAVIAIENARLLNELRESLQQQTATADVLKVISRSTFDLKAVLNTLVESAARLCEADMANIARPGEDGLFQVAATYGLPRAQVEVQQNLRFRPGREALIGRVLLDGAAVHIEDAAADPEYTLAQAQKTIGFRTMLGVPLMREGAPIGVFGLARRAVRPFTAKQVELLTTFADQAVIAMENVRLFDEIQDKSRQLAEASQHKSQFLANMSHELRTPLNAILGYTELIADGVYGPPSEKMLAVLKRLESNGKHLLGLINDVLDLSKIEAGQLKLSLDDYSMKDVVYNVVSAVEPLAANKNLKFTADVLPNMPNGRGDERRLTQVLLNLAGNAIKFTDTGEVTIRVAAANGSFSVAVHDTGPGISAADQAKLFEEFQQADNSITKSKGGTGLGLAISRRIIELHGGRIWVESNPGAGSTFTFTLPLKVEHHASPS